MMTKGTLPVVMKTIEPLLVTLAIKNRRFMYSNCSYCNVCRYVAFVHEGGRAGANFNRFGVSVHGRPTKKRSNCMFLGGVGREMVYLFDK